MGLQLNEIDRFNLRKQLVNKPKVFRQYDPTVKVPREELEDLIDAAIQAPSSWDEQHWKFLIFDDQEIKEKYLSRIAGSQAYIRDSSAVVAVLGDRKLYQGLNSTELYSLNEAKAEPLSVCSIEQEYSEGLKKPPLSAIQFMMGATARGYDTLPILQFDSDQLAEAFNIPDQFVPVLLIAIGRRKESSTNGSMDSVL